MANSKSHEHHKAKMEHHKAKMEHHRNEMKAAVKAGKSEYGSMDKKPLNKSSAKGALKKW